METNELNFDDIHDLTDEELRSYDIQQCISKINTNQHNDNIVDYVVEYVLSLIYTNFTKEKKD